MVSSKPWIKVGNIVGLCRDACLVARGIVVTLDPLHTIHGSILGNDRILVRVLMVDAVQPNVLDFEEDDDLAWNSSDLLRLADDEEKWDSSDFVTPVVEHTLTDDIIIKRSEWPRLMVKVVDSDNVTFSLGMVTATNPDSTLQGVRLSNTHVGIMITEFIVGATHDHLRYKDCLVPWPIQRLLAPGGRSLQYHSLNQDKYRPATISRKRSYVSIVRPKKKPPTCPSRLEEAVSPESILLIGTHDCCKRKCCQFFDRELARTGRERYFSKPFSQRKVEEVLAIQNVVDTNDGEKIVGVEGRQICLEAWRILHFKKRTQFDLTQKSVMAGLTISEHGNKGKTRRSERFSQSLVSLKMIIDESADNHPAKLRTMADNSKRGLRELPTSMTWESVREKVNAINKELSERPISQATMSLLHQTYFKDVLIHRKGNNFSKCNTCSELQQRKSVLTGGIEELKVYRRDEAEHHVDHTEGRLLYKAWRAHSVAHPKESICVIHDKMDHSKTALPKMPLVPKDLENCLRLPITVTGILTHGHGPKAIAQYNVAGWPSDSNSSIGSIDTILQMMENPEPMISTLLEGPDSNKLFTNLLSGRKDVLEDEVQKAFKEDIAFIDNEERRTSAVRGECFRPLPRLLRLQLDNAPSDNKNRYMMAYLSLLTANKVFEEVQLGFLMVGHTHEDVDAMFGNFLECLMHRPGWTLIDLMKLFLHARKPHPIPHFVQEVLDFKGYVEPFLLSGREVLVGHLIPRLFRFYVRDDKMPCFQYKLKSNDDVPWLPENGIELWSWKSDGTPNLPTGMPKRLPMMEIKMLDEVRLGIQKHVKFIRLIANRSETEESRLIWDNLAVYWSTVLDTLEREVLEYRPGDGEDLKDGFWPRSRWRQNAPSTTRNFACQLDAREDYVGPKKNVPRQAFNPITHILKGHIILQRPATEDRETYSIHLGKVVKGVEEGDFNNEAKLEHECTVEWFRPCMAKKRVTLKERWKNCWTKKWEHDQEQYRRPCKISVNSIVWAYQPRNLKWGLVIIPKAAALKAQDNLQRCVEEDP